MIHLRRYHVSRCFHAWLREYGAPYHIFMDGAQCLNGLEIAMQMVHGDKAPSIVPVEHGDLEIQTTHRGPSTDNFIVRHAHTHRSHEAS